MKKLFENYIKSENIIFKYARGKSKESGREYHMYNEIIYFLDGEAEFIAENFHVDIPPGTLFLIPKHTYHQVKIKGDHENYFRCILNFYDFPEIASFFNEITDTRMLISPGSDIRYLLNKLIKNINTKNAEGILKAVLVLLLNEISQNNSVLPAETIQNIYVKNAVDYINKNIEKKITIEKIASQCMISPSSLSHIFKKEMNISLHKFIIKKRLINARQRIIAGESATTVSRECGFNDYSGFYKQYRKMFNETPSEFISVFQKENTFSSIKY